MTTWYKTSKYGIDIKPVEVTRETPKKIFYTFLDWGDKAREGQAMKVSDYDKYYATFEEAKTALVERLKKARQYHADAEKLAANNIARVLDMKEGQ
jgi:hypothetical protein